MPPPTPDELRDLGQRSLFAAGVSATFGERRVLYDSAAFDVALSAGSRVQLRVDLGGCHLTVEPGLEATGAGPLPDVRIEHVLYRFEPARFELSLTGLAGAIAEPFVEHYLDARVRPRLPAALRAPGYSPTSDPEPSRTLRELTGALALSSAGDGPSAASSTLADARELTVFLQIKLAEDLVVPIEDLGELEIVAPKSTLISVWLRTDGRVMAPALRHVEVRGSGSGLVIRSTGSGLLGALTALEVTRLTVNPGPLFAFEYELLLERLLGAPLHVARLAELLAGRYAPMASPEVRLGSLRPMIDEMLTEGLGMLFSKLLAKYDDVVPGLSLVGLFAA